ncbi:hypothetical protein ACU4GD_11615 [Cupriavidus basilensis]
MISATASLAHGKTETFRAVAGDGGHDPHAAGDLEFDLVVHGALVDCADLAAQLVSCAGFHVFHHPVISGGHRPAAWGSRLEAPSRDAIRLRGKHRN